MTDKTLNGIDCTVCDCHYHTKDDKCTADCIRVNGADAKTSCDTECQTFKPHCCG